MICRNCGHYNWPYVRICRKCGSELYTDFWKGRRLRDLFIFPFFLCYFLVWPIFFRYSPLRITLIDIAVGMLAGVLLALYIIIFLRQRIMGNICLLSKKYSSMIIIGIAISLFYIVFSLLSEDTADYIAIPLTIACWIALIFSFLWLIRYERKNGQVIMQ